MQNLKIRAGFVLLLLLTSLPAFSQHRYTHFPWTYNRTVSAGIGAEGTAFTTLARMRADTISLYSALSVPINPLRGALGVYYNQHSLQNRQLTDIGLGYSFFLPFTSTANLRFGIQQNWQRVVEAKAAETWQQEPATLTTSTDFSALLRRDHLLAGVSVENALQKGLRQYNVLLGFRELESNSWLHSSPFLLIQLRDGQEMPEFRFNYTATVLNTLVLGASAYKNSYYSWGANAGLKLFHSIWLTAGADFKSFNTQPDALELGLRLNFGKGRIVSSPEAAGSSVRLPEKGL